MKDDKAILALRAPKKLIRQLDKAAKAGRRSRSQEMLLRLEESFAKRAPTGAAA